MAGDPFCEHCGSMAVEFDYDRPYYFDNELVSGDPDAPPSVTCTECGKTTRLNHEENPTK